MAIAQFLRSFFGHASNKHLNNLTMYIKDMLKVYFFLVECGNNKMYLLGE